MFKKKESIKAKDSIHYSSLEIVGRQMIGFLEALAREKRVYLCAGRFTGFEILIARHQEE